jgi:nitronate monooxygenase
VSEAGGLGFLATGYKTPARRARGDRDAAGGGAGRSAVNLFVPSPAGGDPADVERYASGCAPRPSAMDAELGTPRHDDDAGTTSSRCRGGARRRRLLHVRLPRRATVARLQAAGAAVWVTVTTAAEAGRAAAVGADALVVQGVEAAATAARFDDAAPG